MVHVVANGFASTRSPGAVQSLVKDLKITTINKYREHQLAQELADLEETCAAIRAAHRKKHAPGWLIVAVDKVDLYHDTITKAQVYYSPQADSPFADRLRKLAFQVGTDYFRWEAVPVCAWLEAFKWNNQVADSQIEPNVRDAYLTQFLDEIKNFCA